MKKYALAFVMMFSVGAYAAESAGVTGMVITNDTVEKNNFAHPKNIHTFYFPNAPTGDALFLAYVTFKETGTHQPSVEITDKNGKYVDRCILDPINVTKTRWTQIITCRWGGYKPDGGLTFTIYNIFGGKQEKIGELFLAAKNLQ